MMKKLSEEEELRLLRVKYDVPEDKAKIWLESGARFADIDKGIFYAKLAGIPLEDVLALRKENPWGVVEKKLGLTAENVRNGGWRLRARCMNRWWGFNELRSLSAFAEGYPMHWIKVAWILSEHSDMRMENILAKRKRSEKWEDWAEKNLGIPAERVQELIREYRNPTLPPKKAD